MIEMKIESNAPKVGYLDTSKDHRILCLPEREQDEDLNNLFNYEISIVDLSSAATVDKSTVTSNENLMKIPSSFLTANHVYELTCLAKGQGITGGVKQRFDSIEFDTIFSFTVTSNTTVPFDSLFTF